MRRPDDEAIGSGEIASALESDWGLAGCDVLPLDAGMNSRTWLVHRLTDRWVAKAVPVATQPGFADGLAVARLVQESGIPAGAARPTLDGRFAITLRDRSLALLTFVHGRPLTTDTDADLVRVGATLGRVHRALLGRRLVELRPSAFLDLFNSSGAHLDIEPWIRPAVTGAIEEVERLRPVSLTQGLLHTDPAPEAFRLGDSGSCGIIDWDRAVVGPLLYDVASAVMYAGGPGRAGPLLEAYLAAGPLEQPEIDRGLLPFLRFRFAIQADYFARRATTDDMTGIAVPDDNHAGLDDARRGFMRWPAAQ